MKSNQLEKNKEKDNGCKGLVYEQIQQSRGEEDEQTREWGHEWGVDKSRQENGDMSGEQRREQGHEWGVEDEQTRE